MQISFFQSFFRALEFNVYGSETLSNTVINTLVDTLGKC